MGDQSSKSKMARSAPPKPTHAIKTKIFNIYRLFFLTIEPISALIGAYFSSFQQHTYLHLTHAPSAPPPANNIPTSTHIILLQLSNLYLFFAINEALVLRVSSDRSVWRAVLFTLLVADVGHLYSVHALGPQVYWNVWRWNAIDWGNVGFVYAGAMMRVLFLLGVGLPNRKRETR